MLKGIDLVEYAKDKVGTPYFYGCRMEVLTNSKAIGLSKSFPTIVTPNYIAKAISQGQINKVNNDCSGLIADFTKKNLSSSQLYSTASARLSTKDSKFWADGVITWRRGHVGVFYHNLNNEPIVVEAKGINYGTVFSQFIPDKWTNGLTFDWMEYSYKTSVPHTARKSNPYSKPTRILRRGMRGDEVKWLQFELIESGYDLSPF